MYSNMLGLRLQLNKKYIIFVSLDEVRHMLCLWAAFKIAKQNKKNPSKCVTNWNYLYKAFIKQVHADACCKNCSEYLTFLPWYLWAVWHSGCVSALWASASLRRLLLFCCQPCTGEALCSPHIKFVKAKEGGKWLMSRSSAALSAHLWHFHLWLKRFQLPL